MCGKNIKPILSLALFALFSAGLLYSQSAKDQIIESLTTYQIKLQSVKQQINALQAKIDNSQSLINNLNQQLTDSQNSSQIAIDELRKQLAESEALLTIQREDLEKQAKIYKQLSTDCQKLKTSLALYHNSTWILGSAALAMAGYIVGHIAGLFK